MPPNLVPMVLATLVALAFIADGYPPRPLAGWGGTNGSRSPISLLSRWILGCSLVGLAWVFAPEVKARLPNSTPMFALVGFLALLFLMMLLDALLSGWRPRPYIRPPLRSELTRPQRKQLRRERKQQRLRRTQARRDS